jgi:hypothetical protein
MPGRSFQPFSASIGLALRQDAGPRSVGTVHAPRPNTSSVDPAEWIVSEGSAKNGAGSFQSETDLVGNVGRCDMAANKATRSTRHTTMNVTAPGPKPSWLSLISEASESEDYVPYEVAPCTGGLSCELTPYSSVRVYLSAGRPTTARTRAPRTVDVGLHTDAQPTNRRRAEVGALPALKRPHSRRQSTRHAA